MKEGKNGRRDEKSSSIDKYDSDRRLNKRFLPILLDICFSPRNHPLPFRRGDVKATFTQEIGMSMAIHIFVDLSKEKK